MDYIDERLARVRLGKALRDQGAETFGWKADDSDPYTDYFSPEDWSGVGTYRGYTIGVTISQYRSEHPMYTDRPDVQPTPKGSSWHIEKDGEIYVKGKGLNLCSHWEQRRRLKPDDEVRDADRRADEAAAALASKMLALVDKFESSRMEPSLSQKTNLSGMEPGLGGDRRVM